MGGTALEGLGLLQDSYYTPLEHEELSIPRRKRDDAALPVTVVRPGETIRLGQGFSQNDPYQEARLHSYIQSLGPLQGTAQVEASIQELRDWWTVEPGMFENYTASSDGIPQAGVHFQVIPISINAEYFRNVGKDTWRYLIGRPVLTLLLGGPDDPGRRIRSSWHSLSHALDIENGPILPGDDALLLDEITRRELRVCKYEWQFSTGLYESQVPSYAGDPGLLAGHEIELARQSIRGDGKNGLKPNVQLREIVEANAHANHRSLITT